MPKTELFGREGLVRRLKTRTLDLALISEYFPPRIGVLARGLGGHPFVGYFAWQSGRGKGERG